RVGKIFVKDLRGWLLPRQLAFGIEIDSLGLRLLRRPSIELAPLIRARLKEPCPRKLAVPLALQVIHEKWELDLLAIIDAGLRAEVHVAELVAITTRKPAVIPGPHHQHEVLRRRVLRHEVEHAQWPLRIFLVIPAAD